MLEDLVGLGSGAERGHRHALILPQRGPVGVHTLRDLVWHLPRTHEDRRQTTPIGDLEAETHATVRGRVVTVRSRSLGGGRARSVVTAVVDDGTGTLESQFGSLAYRPGDYLVIPTGVVWRILPDAGVDQRTHSRNRRRRGSHLSR